MVRRAYGMSGAFDRGGLDGCGVVVAGLETAEAILILQHGPLLPENQ
jgi:hypothetical protein